MARLKVSAPYRNFIRQIDSLIKIDQKNQGNVASLSKQQLHIVTEGIFISTFREFERFLEDIFLLYTLEKPTLSNKKPASYLKPRNFDHAFELIKSSMHFLEWNSPDTVNRRAETYLKNGEPIKTVITANMVILRQIRHIRNHIAHNSKESLKKYKKVIIKHYNVLPMSIPRPGEFLLNFVPNQAPPLYYLVYYLNTLKTIATDLTK